MFVSVWTNWENARQSGLYFLLNANYIDIIVNMFLTNSVESNCIYAGGLPLG